MRPKKLVLATVLGLLAFALWYLSKPAPQPLKQEQPPVVSASSEEPLPPPSPAPAVTVPETKAPVAKKSEPAPVKPLEMQAWEVKIDEALRSNADTDAIAQILLQQIPSMPGEGQAASARHIANLIADKDYLSVIPYVRNIKLDPGFQEIMVAESLNRPDVVKLPVLLAAARTPSHPMAEIAKSTLGFLLEGDFGEDWGKWESAVKTALAKQQEQQQQ
jgi:hypothetical protein